MRTMEETFGGSELKTIAVRNTQLIDTLSNLFRINSVNPAYEGGNPESRICEYIAERFREFDIQTWNQEVLPGRPNLIACLPGKDSSRRLLFEAHTDTVSAAGMSISPFQPEIRGGCVYGRGACDTKGGLAAMMAALISLRRERITPPADVWVVAAADEEHSYRGVQKLIEDLSADGAVVAEPTNLRLAIASKGCLRWRIVCRGKAAHSSKPHLGVNAVAQMARVILAIEDHTARLSAKKHPLTGSPTCSIGVIRGGLQVNIVPDSCWIELDRRLIPGEDLSAVWREYQELLENLQYQIPGLDVTMEPPMLTDVPLNTASSASVAVTASQILTSLGLDAEFVGVPYGSDASKLSAAGIASVIFGPGDIDQAHAAAEFVEINQLESAYEFYRELMETFE